MDRSPFALTSQLVAHLALHQVEAARHVVLPIPDGGVEAVPRPSGIEIRTGTVAQLVEPRAVRVDDKDRTTYDAPHATGEPEAAPLVS